MFQKIRHAYEELQKTSGEQRGPIYPLLDDPFKKKYLDTILDQMENMHYASAMETCNEALEHFSDEERFLYYLSVSSRRNGNTGKSVDYAKRLLEMDPENRWYHRELAFAYYKRGWKKKAYSVADEARQMGCDDIEFNGVYGELLCESGEKEKGIREIISLFLTKKHLSDEDLSIVVNCLHYLRRWFPDIDMYEARRRKSRFVFSVPSIELLSALLLFVRKNGARLKSYFEAICYFVLHSVPGKGEDVSEIIKCTEEILGEIKRYKKKPDDFFPEWFLEDWKTSMSGFDDRLFDHVPVIFTKYLISEGDIKDFQLLNARLVILEELDRFLSIRHVLEADYKEIAGDFISFIDEAVSGDANSLRNRLMKQYISRMDAYEHGIYEVVFPEKYKEIERKKNEKGIGYFENPYKRGKKKIGRNDPCPCGSGKKYKLCHGKK